MRSRFMLPVVVAVPGLALAVAGLFHPHYLAYDTSTRWFTLHVAGIAVFPLVGVALAMLVRGRSDALAWAVRLAAYTHAVFYTALDIISGVAAGYVTHQLGPGRSETIEVHYLFEVGARLGHIGEWGLIAAAIAVSVDQVQRHRWTGLPALLLVAAAWVVRSDHIFAPRGVLAMAVIGLTTGFLVWNAERKGPKNLGGAEAQPCGHSERH